MTSEERQEQRLTFVLHNFPGRLMEYMVKSMQKQTAKYGGILSVARLAEGLVRARRPDEAVSLVRSFVKFVLDLCRDLPLTPPQWSQPTGTPPDLLDLAFMRFGHVEIVVRIMTAKSLSHEFGRYPQLVERLTDYLESEPLETRRLDAWLCLSLIAETDPQTIAPFMTRLSGLAAQSTLAGSLVYNDLCDAVGMEELKPLGGLSPAATLIPTVKITNKHRDTFVKALSTWPSMEHRISELVRVSPTASDDILSLCVLWGLNGQVAEDSNEQLRRASDSVYRRYQGVVQPLAWDILRSGYYTVATNAYLNGSLDREFILDIAGMHEINSSLSRLLVDGRPNWYPAPVFPVEGSRSLSSWHSELDTEVSSYIEREMDSLLGIYMADVKPDGNEAWSTSGMAFYYVSEGKMPEACEVWDYLKSIQLVNQAVTTRPFAHPHRWLIRGEDVPGVVGDFVIFPLVGSLAWHGGHHDVPFHLLEAVGVLPGTPVYRDLGIEGDGHISFFTGEQEVAQGHYWGSDTVTRMYSNKAAALTGGYILNACEPLDNVNQAGTTLRLGFVRRSAFTTFPPRSHEQEKTMEEYKFYGVSPLII